MALQYQNKHPSRTTRRPLDPAQAIHRARFASVLAHIPAAADAMRRSRTATHHPRTVFILDWDDTCCATSFLERCGFMADLDTRLDEYASELANHLRLLESRVLSLLKTAVSLGTVLIVTNAGDGWVELSSMRFLPAVRAFLEKNYKLIKIISARARYVDVYREQPLAWKSLTFSDELRAIFAAMADHTHALHVIVLGDSVGDQYAAHTAADSLNAAGMPVVLKVVKFLERPNIDQLCKELSVLLDHIGAMTAHPAPFDVSMYKEPTPQQQQTRNTPLHTHEHHHHQQQQPVEHSAVPQPTPVVAQTTDAQRSIPSVSPIPTCAAAV